MSNQTFSVFLKLLCAEHECNAELLKAYWKRAEQETKKEVVKENEGCIYIFKKGKNAGCACGKKVKEFGLCSAHKKTLKNGDNDDTESVSSTKSLVGKKVIYRHKDLDVLYHIPTNFVFEKQETEDGKINSYVVGRIISQDGNNIVRELCEDDEDEIKEWNFPILEK